MEVVLVRTFAELERLLQATPAPPAARGTVRLICVRRGGGEHECPPRVRVTVDGGVVGDRWADNPHRDRERQITLMSARAAELVAGPDIPPHLAGDNFVVDLDVAETTLPTGSRLRLGSVLLEISAAPHTGCKKFRERFGMDALLWVNHAAHQALRLRGVNCRVVAGGEVAVGDVVEVVGG